MESVARPRLEQPIVHTPAVLVYHPSARPEDENAEEAAFLRLPRREYALRDGQIVEVTGVHFGVLVTACMVMSQNRHGYLQEYTPGSPDPPDPPQRFDLTNTGWDTIMLGEAYQWYVKGTSPESYQICRNFRTWTFDVKTVPEPWAIRMQGKVDRSVQTFEMSATDMSGAVLARDGACCVTNLPLNLNNAHIVPKAEAAWFGRNSLRLYNNSTNLGTEVTEDVRNGLALNANMHNHFVQGRFAIVPKAGVFVVQLLSAPGTDLIDVANREVKLNDAVAVEFLYCRLAYDVMSSWVLGIFRDAFPNLVSPPLAGSLRSTKDERGEDGHGDEGSALDEPTDDDLLRYEDSCEEGASDHFLPPNPPQTHSASALSSKVARNPILISADTVFIDKTSKQYKSEDRAFREHFPDIREGSDRMLGDLYGNYPGSTQLWTDLEPIQAEMRKGTPIGTFLDTGGPEFQPPPEVLIAARQPDSVTKE